MDYEKADGTRPTRRESAYFSAMMQNLMVLQEELKGQWVDRSLPEGWNAIEPVAPATTRLTLRLDTDLARWFRKLGPGYQKCINQILRVYVEAAMSGRIAMDPGLEESGPSYLPQLVQMAKIDAMTAGLGEE